MKSVTRLSALTLVLLLGAALVVLGSEERVALQDEVTVEPDAKRTYVEMVTARGFPYEEHVMSTRDGYQLTLQRIPPAAKHAPPVLLVHGLLDWGVTWYLTGDNSMALTLSRAGYDVWMLNNRGTLLSSMHQSLSTSSKEFWQFSFDHMADYDCPDAIDFILAKTGYAQLSYVGHSEGTVQMFGALASERGPKISSKLRAMIGIGPVLSLQNSQNYWLRMVSRSTIFSTVFKTLFTKEFNPANRFMNMIAPYFCQAVPGICNSVIETICGPTDKKQISSSTYQVMSAHEPGGTSAQNMRHWLQLVAESSLQLRKFDWGSSSLNYKHYGQSVPPYYDFKQMRALNGTAFHMFAGTTDTLVDWRDVTSLTRTYFPANTNVTLIDGYDHLTLLWGDHAPTTVVAPSVKILLREYPPDELPTHSPTFPPNAASFQRYA